MSGAADEEAGRDDGIMLDEGDDADGDHDEASCELPQGFRVTAVPPEESR